MYFLQSNKLSLSSGEVVQLNEIVVFEWAQSVMETAASSLYAPVKPRLTEFHVISLCRRIYGIVPADLVELDGYDDQNFWIKVRIKF